jgi:hypothetical protein
MSALFAQQLHQQRRPFSSALTRDWMGRRGVLGRRGPSRVSASLRSSVSPPRPRLGATKPSRLSLYRHERSSEANQRS